MRAAIMFSLQYHSVPTSLESLALRTLVDIWDSLLNLMVVILESLTLLLRKSKLSYPAGKLSFYPLLVGWFLFSPLHLQSLLIICRPMLSLAVCVTNLIDSIGISFGVLQRKKGRCTWLGGRRFVELKVLVVLGCMRVSLGMLLF